MSKSAVAKASTIVYFGRVIHSIVALAVLMQMKQLKYMQKNLTIITSPIRQALRKNADLFQLDRL